MWKCRVFYLAALLFILQGSEATLSRMSLWDEMLAKMMSNEETGVGGDECYVVINGKQHYFKGEPFVHQENPCLQYICKQSDGIVEREDIQCHDIPTNCELIKRVGKCCPECIDQDFPVPTLTPWSPWTECSKSCGGGLQERTRTCIIPDGASDDGECAGQPFRNVSTCNSDECPIDCEIDGYIEGVCSVLCGTGIKTISPNITQHPQFDGKSCPADEVVPCVGDKCPVDCKVITWGPYEECSVDCGMGRQCRVPDNIEPAENGGEECPEIDCKTCEGTRCPVDCKVITWRPYEECSVDCGMGRQCRVPDIIEPAENGGEECPEIDCKTCEGTRCPVDCEVLKWKPFGKCNGICGTTRGVKCREPRDIKPARYGGKDCPREDCQTCQLETLVCCDGQHLCKRKCINTKDDKDKDCILNDVDSCEDVYNPGKAQYTDSDDDRVPDACDNCKNHGNIIQTDTDGDGLGDYCDPDIDGDGINNYHSDGSRYDNCRKTPNPDQINNDGDTLGDECDNCDFVDNQFQDDKDDNGIGDACDPNYIPEVRTAYAPEVFDNSIDRGNAAMETEAENNLSAFLWSKLMEMYYQQLRKE